MSVMVTLNVVVGFQSPGLPSPFPATRVASPVLLSARAADDPAASDGAYSQRYFRKVLDGAWTGMPKADALAPSNEDVIASLILNLLGHLTAAAVACDLLHQKPLFDVFHDDDVLGVLLLSLAWGIPGALAVSGLELWRQGDSSVRVATKKQPCPRANLEHLAILVGTAPLSAVSAAVLGDDGVGERAASLLLQPKPGTVTLGSRNERTNMGSREQSIRSLALATGGALASCAWAQGVVQTTLCAKLNVAAHKLAIVAIPTMCTSGGSGMDIDFAASCPIVAAGVFVPPLVAMASTTLIVAVFESVTTTLLQPQAAARAEAASAALDAALRRTRSLFSLEASADVASRRVAAFEVEVAQWQAARAEAVTKDRVASVGRAAVGAAVFAASGGCLLAPVVASMGVSINAIVQLVAPAVLEGPESRPSVLSVPAAVAQASPQVPIAFTTGFTLFALSWIEPRRALAADVGDFSRAFLDVFCSNIAINGGILLAVIAAVANAKLTKSDRE